MTMQETYDNRQLLPAACDNKAQFEAMCAQPEGLFNLEEMLPLELIREHTKTDDVPSVSDTQLALYRRAAVEAAEQYTGMVFSGIKNITQTLDYPVTRRDIMQGYFTYELDFPAVDGLVYMYGIGRVQQLRVLAKGRKVMVPIMAVSLDVSSSCCRGPCGNKGSIANPAARLTYQTGFKDMCDIPAGVKLGMLKYVAWSVTHPGDEIVAVRNRTITRSSLVDGTNNVAWASGAIELWRQYDPDYI